MTDDSIPSNCRECPHVRENAYTKGWYCVISGAPLGSRRAQDFCARPKGGSPAASATASSASGQSSEPSPEASKEAASESSPSQNIGDKDGAGVAKQAAVDPLCDDDLAYGYPFDFV